MVPSKILPGIFTLSSDAEQPIDDDGSFNLYWTVSSDADNYSLYESNSFILEIDENVTLLEEGLQSDPYPIQKIESGTYYYLAVAFNENGNKSSNSISVEVEITPDITDPPQEFELLIDAETPKDSDGNFTLTWTDSLYAENYSLYESSTFISEIDENLTLLA
jgi:hypothetical protein